MLPPVCISPGIAGGCYAYDQDVFGERGTNVDPAGSRTSKTWDEMTWWEKLGTYTTKVIPGAVIDTVGVGRDEAWTPGNTPGRVGDGIATKLGALIPSTTTSFMVIVALVTGLVLVLAIVKRV